ncbi:unnamed protein product [Rotaria magnacalcarata]|uniref:Uncharacterized protein n=1 Tax=Rotaria magnacalcarata TaxID=392030 RepID=A0A819XBL2_9BILA|nr:unnamed protein product [Rotaria magnacalcarata]
MAKAINNYPKNDHHPFGNDCEILEQGSSNVQVDRISRFLLECPEAASSVHKYLQKNYAKSNQQQQFVQPVNSTPKRGRPLDESGSSINNGREHRKYPRKEPQQSSSPMLSDERQHQEINQATIPRIVNEFPLIY